jgi:protein-arginine kinase activator protein McsA|tara:strand:- start:464 stop:694 length:231 start_codon:yes stop_codon:yes gene_type:complete
MTEEEMENIANLVVQKLVKLQQDGEIYLGLAQEEVLLAEIARLTTLLSMYESREQYEAASIIHNKIKHLESKLRKI